MSISKSVTLVALGSLWLSAVASSASAETIMQALASAYSSNPQINAARAQTRGDDENVPIARSGYFPTLTLSNSITGTHTDSPFVTNPTTYTDTVALTVSQNIFTGFRVRNAVRQSEAGVLASRESLRNTVENVLFDAAQAYMNVLRDMSILDIRQRNVIFLEEQVRAANERFNVGENTRTDVAQAQASLASARAAVSLAEANLATSRATYRQVVGHEPGHLVNGFPFSRLIPRRLGDAVMVGQNDHPVILAAIHQADAQAYAVKQIEGELLPTVSLQGTIQHAESIETPIDPNSATFTGRISIPILPSGVGPRIRQAKEQYGRLKIQVDLARDQVRAAVVTAWAQENAARGAITAANEGVGAAEIALSGVQEEQKVGQRTTLDVLDAQQTLLTARETLITARHDRVVAYFSLLSAMGRLTAQSLALPAPVYDPTAHYRAVRHKVYGSRTPDGR